MLAGGAAPGRWQWHRSGRGWQQHRICPCWGVQPPRTRELCPRSAHPPPNGRATSKASGWRSATSQGWIRWSAGLDSASVASGTRVTRVLSHCWRAVEILARRSAAPATGKRMTAGAGCPIRPCPMRSITASSSASVARRQPGGRLLRPVRAAGAAPHRPSRSSVASGARWMSGVSAWGRRLRGVGVVTAGLHCRGCHAIANACQPGGWPAAPQPGDGPASGSVPAGVGPAPR